MKFLSSRNNWIYIIYLSLFVILLPTSFFWSSCNDTIVDPPVIGDGLHPNLNCVKEGNILQLDCPAPPNTNLSAQPDFDIFAWNTFAALNWPALINEDPTKFQRGIPNITSNKSFITAKHDDVLVWETFKEKREVFNVSQGSTQLPSWNSFPNYGTLRKAEDQISYVPGILPGSSTTDNNLIFNTLDESIEVKSEGLEGDKQSNPFYGKIVSPRVWRGEPAAGNPVLYEVKVNYDFYDYVDYNKFFIDTITQRVARDPSAGPVTLPYRTSASKASIKAASTKERQNRKAKQEKAVADNNAPGSKFGYNSQDALASYLKNNNSPNSNNTPFSIGSVHIKAAWIQLTATDDTSTYHTTNAEYYVSDSVVGIKKQYATFGLVGLHIIQRIHTGNLGSSDKNVIGGTFIFSTWEHVNTETGYTYSNYLSPKAGTGLNPTSGWFPHKDSPRKITPGGIGHGADTLYLNPDTYPVVRKFPILPGTQKVNQQVWNALPAGSVWKNYRLIGTQFKAVNSLPKSSEIANHNDPYNIGQPQYLANLVIETNEGLQHFQGQPPLTYPIQRYTSAIPPHHQAPTPPLISNGQPNFARMNLNVVAGGHAKNMGGCMGCHGVAQSEGYSFSFVLLGGYGGATTDTQAKFDLPPPIVYSPSN